jgi:soluble lytic murein transglycosylase-like protein
MRMGALAILGLMLLVGAGIADRIRNRPPPAPPPAASSIKPMSQLAIEIRGVASPHAYAFPAIADAVLEVSGNFRSHGVTPAVVLGIIEAESDFRPSARGRHGELGLMQLRLERRAEFMHVRPNIEYGVAYLTSLHDYMVAAGIEGRDEFHASLIAYNAGPSTLTPAGRKVSLRHYVKVRKAIARWRAKGY